MNLHHRLTHPSPVVRARLAAAIVGVGLTSGLAWAATGVAEPPIPPAGPIGFQAPADPEEIGDVARIAVVADTAAIRPGATFHLAFNASMASHWHTYWLNPGDTGVPVQIDVKAPAGFTVGELRYPRPEVIVGPEGTTYGYEDEAWIFVPVTAPADLETDGRAISFELDVMYLVCRDICLIGTGTRTVSIPTATDAQASRPAASTEAIPAMRPWLARLPADFHRVKGAAMSVDLDAGRLSLRLPRSLAPGEPVILPAPGPGVSFGRPVIVPDADGHWDITVPLTLRPGNTLGKPFIIRGLVGLGEKPTDPAWRFDRSFPVPPAEG